MLALLDLPIELLQQAAAFLLPDDLENVSQTNKVLYTNPIPAIQEHRDFKRRYSSLSYTPIAYLEYPFSRHLDDDLMLRTKEVLERPRIVHYIRKLVVKGVDRIWDAKKLEDTSREEDILEIAGAAAALKGSSLSIPTACMNHADFIEEHRGGIDWTLLIFYMSHCPNLSTFEWASRAWRGGSTPIIHFEGFQ